MPSYSRRQSLLSSFFSSQIHYAPAFRYVSNFICSLIGPFCSPAKRNAVDDKKHLITLQRIDKFCQGNVIARELRFHFHRLQPAYLLISYFVSGLLDRDPVGSGQIGPIGWRFANPGQGSASCKSRQSARSR